MNGAVEKIAELDLLSDDGLIVAEHHQAEILPDKIGAFTKIKEKKYGTIIVDIYSK